MTSASPTLALTCDLIIRPSVTPEDAGCLQVIADRLEKIGFNCQSLPFEDVSNLWAVRGDSGPLFVFAGHTDVVPTGPQELWRSPPFEPTIKDGILTGRGAADMKGSLAAMVIACENFIAENPNHSGRIGFLLTSDEEGPAKNGTVKVMEWLKENEINIDWCLIGEPTSSKTFGDMIKNGRRGSLNFELTVKGIQGHIAYPHLAENPIHTMTPALKELTEVVWDQGNEYFPATSFQISNINGGTGATNVIPGEVKIVGNFRFSTELTEEKIIQKTQSILEKHKVNFSIDWQLSGLPFITEKGVLVNAISNAIESVCDTKPELSTTGGTSDGRFIATYGVQVIEFGPLNESIHKIDECVAVKDLEKLAQVYEQCLKELLK